MPKRPDMPCTGCGLLMWRTKRSATVPKCRQCREDESAVRRARTCEQCGVEFLLPARAPNNPGRFCSRLCMAEGFRAQPGVPRECTSCGVLFEFWLGSPVTECDGCRPDQRPRPHVRLLRLGPDPTGALAARDGADCGICHQPVDLELVWPDPASASIDHVVPLAKGGEHTAANVQLAHLQCNRVKQDREDFTLAG